MKNKLYIEYRVYFDPNTNQELLNEVAELAQEEIFSLFANTCNTTGDPIPDAIEVTYEIVVEAKLIIDSNFEFRQEPK